MLQALDKDNLYAGEELNLRPLDSALWHSLATEPQTLCGDMVSYQTGSEQVLNNDYFIRD